MLKQNEFVCYISKELSKEEFDKDIFEVSKKMQSFMGDSFNIEDVEEFNNHIYLTCICNNIKDYEYLRVRSSYLINKKPLK